MASPEPRDPVVVEPIVNLEKLNQLLALQTEYSTLDFKEECDLSSTRDKVELAKDVGAMSVEGGFVVVGAEGHGTPTGKLTPQHAPLFDESRLRPILLAWLPDSLEVHSQVHDLNGNLVALVYIAPNPAGCAFFRAVGQYQHPSTGRPVVVFRQGDVFFRDGTSSTPLNQQGLEKLIARRIAAERRRWDELHAAEYRRLAAELRAGVTGQQVSFGSAAEFNLSLEPDVLAAAAIELVRRDDDVPVRLLLRRAVPETRTLYDAHDANGLEALLDRLACLAAVFLELGRREWFEQVVDTLVAIYGMPYDVHGLIGDYPPEEAASLWLAVIQRVLALGALAVRLDDWLAVRYLATRQEPRMHRVYPAWIRHALTMATRVGLLATFDDNNREIKISLLSLARELVRRLGCLRPELAEDDEQILTSLAQFDFLACLVPMTSPELVNERGFYTNFARFRGDRVVPIADRLVEDHEMRQVLTPLDDETLAQALLEIHKMARQEGLRYDGWMTYGQPVVDFIKEHLPPEQPETGAAA